MIGSPPSSETVPVIVAVVAVITADEVTDATVGDTLVTSVFLHPPKNRTILSHFYDT